MEGSAHIGAERAAGHRDDAAGPRAAGTTGLPEIPVIEALGPAPAAALMASEEGRLHNLVDIARGHYGRGFIAAADRLSRRWVGRNTTPYGGEIAAIASGLGRPGGWFLNASFEWSCTCGLVPDPETGGFTLLRVLDWPLEGLGRHLVASLQDGPAGEFVNLTWPGFAGAVTALAAGRFGAAVNQAPLTHKGLGFAGDWAVQRLKVWNSRELPPMHLLRQVFERCRTYEDARLALIHTPIALPAIFTLAGARPGEGCVIERLAGEAVVHDAPTCVANHWLNDDWRARDRGTQSRERLAAMQALLQAPPDWSLGWVSAPLLNGDTRLVAMLDPAGGRALAQGFEPDGPATAPLKLAA